MRLTHLTLKMISAQVVETPMSPTIVLCRRVIESRFLEPPRETKIGSKNGEVRKIRAKIKRRLSKGNENWFEKSGDLRNRSFEKSGFQCTALNRTNTLDKLPILQSSFNVGVHQSRNHKHEHMGT